MSKKVLVVDDAAFMRMMIKNILQGTDYEVIGEAGNGKEAVTFYSEHQPDLVTMDITMPVMDGIAAARKILEIDPDANIIMCSAMGQQAMVIDAVEAGAKDFIVKPFKEDRVLGAIKKVFND
ncbi:MAG: response regulator [Bacillota bacterium]